LKFSPGSISICLLAALFLAAGCASVGEKTRFYTLSVPSDIREKDPYPEYSVTPIFIEVMPVSIPERLARPQLVVSSKGQEGELLVLEQARWSSPFNYELRDALAAAIAGRTGAIKVNRGGRLHGQPVYRIAVELSQFDATIGGTVNARFDWTITSSTQGRSAACYSAISEAAGRDVESLVKGIQDVVEAAAENISENLMQLNGGGAASCGFMEN
jgi:uncharacterized lipoprotein YmbA